MTTLYGLTEQSASAALEVQRSNGAMPSGHNGPYYDPETPVRNTSHWLITFLKAYQISGDPQFREAAERAVNYLCSREARPMKASFWHQKTPEKGTCNGLIGQAWTIEALAVAARELEDAQAAQVAEEVFMLHPFNEKAALWTPVNADGTYHGVDHTFNHQLWFAAAGGLLAPHAGEEVQARVTRFLDRMSYRLRTHPSGLIRHLIVPEYSWKKLIIAAVQRTKNFLAALRRGQIWAFRRKEVGYHAFNLYGMALLKSQYPDHSFWKSKAMRTAWDYAKSDSFREEIRKSEYGYPYNPPGFEMAFAYEMFGDGLSMSAIRQRQTYWIVEQVRRCYDFGSKMMNRNTEDPETHAARLYEAVRLPNIEIDMS